MGKFQTLLAPLRRKLLLEGFIQRLLRFWLAASVVGLAVVLLSKIIFMPDAVMIVFLIFGVISLFAIGYAVVKRPRLQEVATVADALGGQERMVTSLELLQKQESTKIEKVIKEVKKDEALSTEEKKLLQIWQRLRKNERIEKFPINVIKM